MNFNDIYKKYIKKIVSVFLVIILAIGLISCDSDEYREDNLQLRSQKRELERRISNLENELQSEKRNEKDLLEQQAKSLFNMAELFNSISAYEIFIHNSANLKPLEDKAVNHIYQLTEQADIIEGYRYFLNNYPNTPYAKNVNYRLYEIAYQVAENDNNVSSYNSFLSNFKGAPKDLRDKALDKAVSSSCQSLNSEYEKSISTRSDDEIYRQFLVDKIGRRTYEEALNARESNQSLFQQKYNTILKCNLFSGSNTKFGLLRDSELAKLLNNIENQIKEIREDINKSNSLILEKISAVQSVQRIQNAYMKEIGEIVQKQNEILESVERPSSWNDDENTWDNYIRIGTDALDVMYTARFLLGVARAL